MIIAVLIVAGLIFGSFTNALIWRFHEQAELAEHPKKKSKQARLTKAELSMVKGRSMCSHCHHELAPIDLVPLFSWLYLRGKCRYCHVRIQDSPLLELVMPLLFVLSYVSWPQPLQGLGLYQFSFWLVFIVGFMALAAYDLRWYLLPDRIVFPLIGLALVERVGQFIFYGAGWATFISVVWGVAIASGIFYVLYQLSDGSWIGGGDVKLGIVLGILVGGPLPAIGQLFLASVLGTLVAVPMLVSGKAGRSTPLPFGPFLLIAAFLVVLYGDRTIQAYYGLLGL